MSTEVLTVFGAVAGDIKLSMAICFACMLWSVWFVLSCSRRRIQ
jgi:hypothetical protein